MRNKKLLIYLNFNHLKLILKTQNFVAFEFDTINSYQFLLIHIFFPRYARNGWPRKRVKLNCIKTRVSSQVASIVVRYSIAIVYNDASVLSVLKEKKKIRTN